LKLSLVGEEMSAMSGVRSILKDIAEHAARQSLINLSAGNPLVLPEVEHLWRKHLSELMEDAAFGEIIGRYGSSQGYEPFIETVVEMINRNYNWGITAKNVLVTAGSQSLYFMAVNAFTGMDKDGRPRRLVLPLCPDYTGYQGVSFWKKTVVSFKPVVDVLGEHRFKHRLDLDRLTIDGMTGAVLFSRPCNPSGNVMTEREVLELIHRSRSRDVPVIIDSAYAPPFPNLSFIEMRPIWGDNVIHCLSLSKAGLPGERIGVAIAHERYIRILESFQANMNIHPSRLGQAIAARAIRSGELEAVAAKVIRPFYEKKFRVLEAALDQCMPDVPWYLHVGEGSIFAWVWFDRLPIRDLELYQLLKKEGLIVVPGFSFFQGLREAWDHTNQCIRISLTASDEEIEQGVRILAKVLREIYR